MAPATAPTITDLDAATHPHYGEAGFVRAFSAPPVRRGWRSHASPLQQAGLSLTHLYHFGGFAAVEECPDHATGKAIFPANPDVASFSVVHSKGEIQGEGGAGFEPAVIGPGDTKTLTIGNRSKGGGGPGRYMVLSYLPGHYERGSFVEFTVTTPDGVVSTIFQPGPPASLALEVGDVLAAWTGATLERKDNSPRSSTSGRLDDLQPSCTEGSASRRGEHSKRRTCATMSPVLQEDRESRVPNTRFVVVRNQSPLTECPIGDVSGWAGGLRRRQGYSSVGWKSSSVNWGTFPFSSVMSNTACSPASIAPA